MHFNVWNEYIEFYTTVEYFKYVFSKVMGPKQLKNWGEEWDYDLENVQPPPPNAFQRKNACNL